MENMQSNVGHVYQSGSLHTSTASWSTTGRFTIDRIDIFIPSSCECTGLISTNSCLKRELREDNRSLWVKRLLIRWTAERPPALFFLFWWAMMKAQVDARKSSPPPTAVDSSSVVSAGVEVCSLAAGHSGSVLTKLCLFPGLQGSQGKLCSRGKTNKKAPLSRTLELLSNTSISPTQQGCSSLLRRGMQKEARFFRAPG